MESRAEYLKRKIALNKEYELSVKESSRADKFNIPTPIPQIKSAAQRFANTAALNEEALKLLNNYLLPLDAQDVLNRFIRAGEVDTFVELEPIFRKQNSDVKNVRPDSFVAIFREWNTKRTEVPLDAVTLAAELHRELGLQLPEIEKIMAKVSGKPTTLTDMQRLFLTYGNLEIIRSVIKNLDTKDRIGIFLEIYKHQTGDELKDGEEFEIKMRLPNDNYRTLNDIGLKYHDSALPGMRKIAIISKKSRPFKTPTGFKDVFDLAYIMEFVTELPPPPMSAGSLRKSGVGFDEYLTMLAEAIVDTKYELPYSDEFKIGGARFDMADGKKYFDAVLAKKLSSTTPLSIGTGLLIEQFTNLYKPKKGSLKLKQISPKYYIDINHLRRNILSLKTATDCRPKFWPNGVRISNELKRMVAEFVEEKKLDTEEYNLLSNDEREIFDKMIDLSNAAPLKGFGNKFTLELQRDRCEILKRFELLKGEIMAGNDNPKLLKDLKLTVAKMLEKKYISTAEAYRIFHILLNF